MNALLNQRSMWLAVGFALSFGCGCDDAKKDKATGSNPDRQAYETAIAELGEPVGLIAAYLPYLTIPKRKLYEPAHRRDLQHASFYAANEIRHAANVARQQAVRSQSVVSQGLVSDLVGITKQCTRPKSDEDVAQCAKAVTRLDDALAKLAEKATAAGVTGKIPRIKPEAVTDKARKTLAPFVRTLGPGPVEKTFLTKLADPKATPGELMSACEAAASEAEGVMDSVESLGDEIHKVGAHHKLALDSRCTAISVTDGIQQELKKCIDEKKKMDDCKLICANAKTALARGIPAAAFSKLEEQYGELCQKKK